MKRLFPFAMCIFLSGCEIYYGTGLVVPGETRMDAKGKILAAHEAFSSTRAAAKHKAKLLCENYKKNYKVLDTKFSRDITFPYTGNKGWEENWIIEACGTKWRVPIIFMDEIISTSGAFPLK
jgi:hypothetical protein